LARKFTDASSLLHDLLDRHEAGTITVRAYPDHAGFRDVTEADRFERALRHPNLADAIALVEGRGRDRGRTTRVDLAEAEVLYRYLNRTPASSKADEATRQAFIDLELAPAIREVAQEAVGAWSRNKRWCGLVPGDADRLRGALQLAQAISLGRHGGLDYRTFSRRITGNSKALEELEQPLMRLLSGVRDLPAGATARSVLSGLGLDRFGPPLLIAGPLGLDGSAVPAALPYIGIPATAVAHLTFHSEPEYILSIENLTSFNRQVIETDRGRRGAILYTGGFPALDIQKAITHIAARLPSTPFFHWSDIDPEGVWIFRTVERAAGRAILPHMMEREMAATQGVLLAAPVKLRPADFDGSAIIDLVRYFLEPQPRWLEQEELDPKEPVRSSRAVVSEPD